MFAKFHDGVQVKWETFIDQIHRKIGNNYEYKSEIYIAVMNLIFECELSFTFNQTYHTSNFVIPTLIGKIEKTVNCESNF